MRFAVVSLVAVCALFAADAPSSADSILEAAKAQAKDGRAIFADFHASW
jgi:hypothetical protein